MKRKPIYISAAGAIVACAFALATVGSASAAPHGGLFTATPSHVNCGTQQLSQGPRFCEEVFFTNNTSAPLPILDINLVGKNSRDFPVEGTNSNLCTIGAAVPVGGNCSLFIFFDPSATGRRSAALVMFDGTSDSGVSVGLGGRGE